MKLDVQIKQADIDNGDRKSLKRTALALAVNRALAPMHMECHDLGENLSLMWQYEWYLKYRKPIKASPNIRTVQLPREIQWFSINFTTGRRKVKPTTFELDTELEYCGGFPVRKL